MSPSAIRSRWWRMVQRREPLRARAFAALPWMMLAMLVERGLYVLLVQPPVANVYSDMAGYVERAWRLASPGVHLNRFDAFFPPGTHVLMTPLFMLTGDREAGMAANQMLWWLMAVGTLWAVGAIAFLLFGHPVPALLAMMLCWAYLPFSGFAAFFMSENPCAFFLSTTVLTGLLAQRIDEGKRPLRVLAYLGCGLLGGVAVAIRPQMVITVGMLCLFLAAWSLPRLRLLEMSALLAALLLAPLGGVALNRHAAKAPIGLATNGGFNFYQGHCEVSVVETRADGGVYVWASPARLQRLHREGRAKTTTVIQGHMAWEDAYFFGLGMECIRSDGITHVERLLTNLEDFLWGVQPWPVYNLQPVWLVMSLSFIYPFALLACVALALRFKRHQRAEQLLLGLLLTALPVALLFYGDSRFRITYDIFGILLFSGLVASHYGMRQDRPAVPSTLR